MYDLIVDPENFNNRFAYFDRDLYFDDIRKEDNDSIRNQHHEKVLLNDKVTDKYLLNHQRNVTQFHDTNKQKDSESDQHDCHMETKHILV